MTTIDNLLDVHLVTAEGDFVHASAQDNPELFWGVRGGGSNFGGLAFPFLREKLAECAWAVTCTRTNLERLRDFAGEPIIFDVDTHYDQISAAHNIVINEDSAFAYVVGANSGGETCGGGLHMINIEDPNNPSFAGCFADPKVVNVSAAMQATPSFSAMTRVDIVVL